MTQVVLQFSTTCSPPGANFIGLALTHMMFLPRALFFLNLFINIADGRWFFFFASWALLFWWYHYLAAVSDVSKIPRPDDYDWELCRVTQYALPDALYVSSMSYMVTILWGFFVDKKRFGITTALILHGAPILYSVATVYTGYFSVGILLVNLILSLVTGVLFVMIYNALVLIE